MMMKKLTIFFVLIFFSVLSQAQEYIDYKIRTDQFYAYVHWEALGSEPTWQYRYQVGGSYSSGNWSAYECRYDNGAYNTGAHWWDRGLEEVWSGTCLDNADNLYIGLYCWEDQTGERCTYDTNDQDRATDTYDSDNNISANTRNTWVNFNSNDNTFTDGSADCGTTDGIPEYRIQFDVWWNWSVPVDPGLTVTDVTKTTFTINLADKKNYRITDWDYQVSSNAAFSNIVASATEITDLSVIISNLDVNTTYYVRIRGENEAGTGVWTAGEAVATLSTLADTYTVQSGDWDDPNTWSSGVPANNDAVDILSGHTVNLNVDMASSGISLNVDEGGTLTSNGTDNGILIKTGGYFTVYGTVYVYSIDVKNNVDPKYIYSTGDVTVWNFFDHSGGQSVPITVDGKLIILNPGTLLNDGEIIGTGTIDAANYSGTGSIYGISPTSSITGTIGGFSWDGSVSAEWSSADNWVGGAVPSSSSYDVVIQEGASNYPIISTTGNQCRNLLIESGAELTINSASDITLSGVLTIESNATKNGSLIVNGTLSGNVTYNRYLTANNWHLLSAPVSGQSISGFQSGNSIASSGNKYGIAPYNNSTPGWEHYTTDAGSNNIASAGNFIAGKGYEVQSTATSVAFTGTIATSNVDISITESSSPGNSWNLVGNPYPSALNGNSPADASNNFISANAAGLEAAYQAIYVWDAASGSYLTVNHTYNSNSAFYVAPGQAFFVYSKTGGATVSFTEAMQTHQTGDILKSGEIPFPSVKLIAERSQGTSSTHIKYIENMTTGLDPGYDAGHFSGGNNSFAVYTHLVGDETNLVDFDIQCLPSNDFDNIIPVGLNAPENTEVVFRAETINLPADVPLYLEDKVTGTFTALDEPGSFYTVNIASKSEGTGRFFLHTKSSATGINPVANNSDFTIIPRPQNNSIRIIGSFGNRAEIAIYDMAGRKLFYKNLNDTKMNDVDMAELISGFYLVSISSTSKQLSKKISWVKNQ